jgi:hypothetical protein
MGELKATVGLGQAGISLLQRLTPHELLLHPAQPVLLERANTGLYAVFGRLG